jgi:hypothetical protein
MTAPAGARPQPKASSGIALRPSGREPEQSIPPARTGTPHDWATYLILAWSAWAREAFDGREVVPQRR